MVLSAREMNPRNDLKILTKSELSFIWFISDKLIKVDNISYQNLKMHSSITKLISSKQNNCIMVIKNL